MPRLLVVLLLVLLAGCSRGPDEADLTQDVQARLDALFGQPMVEVAALRRQGSAPYRPAADGARQVIVYYNAVLRFVAAYDPSDWESLSPALIAGALGASDAGIFGLGAGRHEPGSQFRGHGSIVYRKEGDRWVMTGERLVGPEAPGAAARAGAPGTDDLVQRLAQMVLKSPDARGAEREIVTEEIDRALRNISLRLEREQAGIALAAGPQGGEYYRFLTSITRELPASSGVRVVATEGSVANAFLIESHQARLGVMQSDVAAAAVTGQGIFSATGPMSHLRAMASLFPEPLHVVVRADAGIERIEDLAGRRIALGSPASGSRHTALRLLANAGVDPAGFALVYGGDSAGALGQLAAGQLDAVVEVVAAPWRQLHELARTTPIRLIGVDAGRAAGLAETVPGLVPLGIPARTYPGQDAVVPTVAATALLVAHSEVADVTVESTLTLLYASAASRGGVLAARLSRERAQTGITIPMHDGARRFFGPAPEAVAVPATH